ncbi:hypothetical protein PoB_002582800 [Plakobranchus ocellatus]|uniref:Uncharacterized protein n=1 Tax=Plakobranchus ocellatus TaxID=259542 RepID=A0AAV3ZY37_9GAST|nr:hypothetical protein PoB_002582800 [Plakobranchus ocellatus]
MHSIRDGPLGGMDYGRLMTSWHALGFPIKRYIRSGSSSGRAVSYQVRGPRFESQSGQSQFFNAPLCPPSTKWISRYWKFRNAWFVCGKASSDPALRSKKEEEEEKEDEEEKKEKEEKIDEEEKTIQKDNKDDDYTNKEEGVGEGREREIKRSRTEK